MKRTTPIRRTHETLYMSRRTEIFLLEVGEGMGWVGWQEKLLAPDALMRNAVRSHAIKIVQIFSIG